MFLSIVQIDTWKKNQVKLVNGKMVFGSYYLDSGIFSILSYIKYYLALSNII